MKATNLCFEKPYADYSGIEKAIQFVTVFKYNNGADEKIEIQKGEDIISFDNEDIAWIIDCLIAIKEEIQIG